jgi:hypothetical protein
MKVKKKTKPRAVFDDTFDVEHVMYLLRNYVECARHRLSPKELETVRANSVLIVLEEKLRDALIATGILERDLNDIPYLYPLTNLQEAYVQALRSVRSAPDPGDWNDKKLNEFDRQLLTIHAINGDIAREEADMAKQARQKGGKGGTDAATHLLRAMCRAYHEWLGKWPTARKLVDVMRANGYIEDAGPNDLRLHAPDGRTAIIPNNMQIIGARLRTFRKFPKTLRN